eukprot:GILJ01013350.1.p1 GENE.GILJ01013350.1~~GILJ01013350.1.p1  ORF type:complete len:279 (-),score=54.02 GILJ01013350.1:158-994(-)
MEEERALQQLERDTNAFLLEAVGSELAVNAPTPFPERDQLHMKNDLSTGSSAVDETAHTAKQLADQMKPLAQTQSELEADTTEQDKHRFIEGLTSCESVGDSGRVIDPYMPAMNESDDMDREEPISENKIQKMEDTMLHAQKETQSDEEDRRAMEEDLKERQKLLEQFGVSPTDEQPAPNNELIVSDRHVKEPLETPQGEQGGLPVDKTSDDTMQTEQKGEKRATTSKGKKRSREEPTPSTEPLRRSGRIRQKHTPGPEFLTDAAIEDDIKRMRRMIH